MGDKLTVLILEDNPSDARLMKRELQKVGQEFTIHWAQDKKSFIAALESFRPDLILSDYSLPGFDALAALRIARQQYPSIPVIIVSGAIGEETAIETLKSGATDYVLKQRLNRLAPVVRRTISEAEQIAERQKAEKALRESEERFRLLVEEVQDYAIMTLDQEGFITSWNQAAERIEGWTADEVLGKHFSVSYPPMEQENGDPQKALELAVDQGRFEFQGQRLRKDGTFFWAEASLTALHDQDGSLTGFANITRDITTRKQAEQELSQAKEEWEITFDSIPDLIAILDNDQHILRANRAMAEKLGMPFSKIIGSHCYQCVHSTKKAPSFCPHPLTLADGRRHFAEIYESRLGGDYLISTNPLRNAQGEVIGIVHIAQEITHRKKMEEALRFANETLEQRVAERTAELGQVNTELQLAAQREQEMHDRLIQSEKFTALSRLVASVAHEVNNPLQTIQNCLHLLASMECMQNGEPQEIMGMAVSETRRISSLVQQLRETYRPDRYTQPIKFNVVELITSVHALIEPQLHEKNIQWQVVSPKKRILIRGIPDRIKQVCLNICLNAIDAVRDNGGQISVKLSLPADGRKVLLAFQDNGRGISPENLQRLFEPFFSTKEKGTGLGLVICYEIVRNHGGDIKVESHLGKGSIFKVTLPLSL